LADNKGEGRKVDEEEEGGDLILPKAKRSFTASFRLFFKSLGPGLVTGASDDNPSGIATYSQAGSQFGFGMLWLALFQFPLMTVVQEMCARIGLVTGSGLASVIKEILERLFSQLQAFFLLQIQ
jgi:Mn2+/Fe2+ NRAMP family transporter